MIPTNITTISDLRYKTKQVLINAESGPVTILHRATAKGIIISVDEFEKLTSTSEDYYLSLRAEELEKEDKKTVSWIPEKTIKKHVGLK
jgi:prevent-host-death family protein